MCPHFFSLAWIHRKDYARGHHQMVPVNDPTGERTARLITGYSLAMFTIPVAATALDVTSSMFALEGVAATGYLTYLAGKFHQQRSDENARKVRGPERTRTRTEPEPGPDPERPLALEAGPHPRPRPKPKVFKCSLWYLPLMLALFVFHRKYSSALEGEAAGDAERGEKGEVGHAPAVAKTKAAPTAPVWLEQAKEFMKTMCVHERIIVKNDASALCPSTSPVDSKGANATDKRVD